MLFGPQPVLTWTYTGRVGIGTTTPGALLSLGGGSSNTKLLMNDYGDQTGIGMGASGGEFRFHLSGGFGESFSFLPSPAGSAVFSIGSGGTVRMGPNTQLYVPGTTENVRIIRGRIAGNGSITTGVGFTVSKTGTGAYTVTFSTAFSGEPSVTATPQVGIARIATCTNVGASSSQFRTFDHLNNAIDQDFHFIAIGPR
jgi:hypothetical protein